MQLLRLLYQRYTFLFCCLCSLFMTTCGIPNLTYLEKPHSVRENSNSEDLSQRYCQFKTADTANSAVTGFQGTEIYYRIYARKDDCENDRSQIDKYNDDNPFEAARYLEETKKYYRLETNLISTRPLIDKHSADVTVRFRLQDYGSSPSDPAKLIVNSVQKGIPQRNTRISPTRRAFNKDNIAVGDNDVQAASSSGTEIYWCVNFYAVSYGYTPALTPLYSELKSLGYILIEKN
ncbi:hypothetical protein JO41_02700 [Treponema sp. OMZ 838]|nr:hypothetical protein JO41_02700 [Treponema sp. OMZ 838]UTC44383.1 hypothetical protein E4N66_10060 [Treponema sp. OMZ 857]UTC51209.1 hypothetical protein E4N65_02360 [Treponema sp. OMZ 855]